MEFIEFPKISRFSRDIIVSEKIDGSNACIAIEEPAQVIPYEEASKAVAMHLVANSPAYLIYAGSRSRWLTLRDDNFGFARWVHENVAELVKLGPGRHFGEWWGSGIQRRYGLTGDDKRFSMFNVQRWVLHGQEPATIPTEDPRVTKTQKVLPACCGLVPVLYRGPFYTSAITECLEELKTQGSRAVPGFMDPEGVVIYHTAGNVAFKKTLLKDDIPKTKVKS